ncbi:MAG: response regulator [Candidatus Tenebribacter davisii]|jgi:DNA-binding NarL/FixJ family response regulator|nr:response regulator [Candidatus Tenebribacter davisii]
MKKKIKILLAEDELLIAQCLKMELEMAGYEVCNYASSGEEAISLAQEEDPDIVLMDIHLSGDMDGIKAAQKIIEHKKIPIVFMTGYNDINIHNRAEIIKPIAILEKPVELYDLEPIIDSIFNKK